MSTSFTFFHQGEKLTVILSNYADGPLAVMAVDEYGLPYATLSVNLPESKKLDGNQFFLKDYSENEAVANSFIEQVPLYPSPTTARAGFVTVQMFAFDSRFEMPSVER